MTMSFYMNFGAVNEAEHVSPSTNPGKASIGYRSRSTEMYDTATKNPKNARAIVSIAQAGSRGYGYNAVGGDDVDKYKEVRKNDRDLAKKADKIAAKATGVSNRDYRKANKGDEEALKRVEKREIAADATRRHMRRHPEAYKEFGIFAEACFIDE